MSTRSAATADAVGKLLGKVDVEPRDVADTLGIDAAEVDQTAEPDARQDGKLVRSVDTVDIKARIGFGIAEFLRLGEHFGELVRGLAHRRQNVIRSPVENAVDAGKPVSGETLAQRLDHWNPAGNGSLEGKDDTLFLGPYGEPGSVMRHQRLVRGDDVLAMVERRVDHIPRDAISAPDQLDNDVNLGIGRHRAGVLVPAHRREIDPAIATPVTRGDRSDDEPAAGALCQEIGLPVEQLQGASSHSAESRDGNL